MAPDAMTGRLRPVPATCAPAVRAAPSSAGGNCMQNTLRLDGYEIMPQDGDAGALVARVWRPASGGQPAGPSVAAVRGGDLWDISRSAPTTAALFDRDDAVAVVRGHPAERIGTIQEIVA